MMDPTYPMLVNNIAAVPMPCCGGTVESNMLTSSLERLRHSCHKRHFLIDCVSSMGLEHSSYRLCAVLPWPTLDDVVGVRHGGWSVSLSGNGENYPDSRTNQKQCRCARGGKGLEEPHHPPDIPGRISLVSASAILVLLRDPAKSAYR